MTEEIKINEQATKAQLQRLREAVSAMQRAVEIYAKWFTDIVEEATRFSDDFTRLLAEDLDEAGLLEPRSRNLPPSNISDDLSRDDFDETYGSFDVGGEFSVHQLWVSTPDAMSLALYVRTSLKVHDDGDTCTLFVTTHGLHGRLVPDLTGPDELLTFRYRKSDFVEPSEDYRGQVLTHIIEVLQAHFEYHKGDEPWIAHSE